MPRNIAAVDPSVFLCNGGAQRHKEQTHVAIMFAKNYSFQTRATLKQLKRLSVCIFKLYVPLDKKVAILDPVDDVLFRARHSAFVPLQRAGADGVLIPTRLKANLDFSYGMHDR